MPLLMLTLATLNAKAKNADDKMKHAIVKVPVKAEWIVRGVHTGRILGRHDSRAAAVKQLKAVEWSMHGRRRTQKRPGRHSIWPTHVHSALAALIVLAFLGSGCAGVKSLAPNSWNVTVYTDPQMRTQQFGFGISGPLPGGH